MMDNAAVLNQVPAGDDDAPLFTVLTRFKDCEEILARNNVGRIAFALQDRVSIVPVHYVYTGGWIYGRTAAGGKLRELLRNRRVAFEVDEHTQMFDWRSVVVRGPLYLIEPGTTAAEACAHATAVSLIRKLVPSALTGSDPVPFRDQLFRIRVVEISGRTSDPTGGKRLFPAIVKTTDRSDTDSDALLCQRAESAIAGLALSSGSDVHIEVFDGLVVLTGVTADAAERNAIESTVLALPGVQVVVQQIETAFPSQSQPTPTEIAREAVRQLALSPSIADAGINVVVDHGWLRLEGIVNSEATRDEVERRLRTVRGSRGVIDKLHVRRTGPARVVSDR
jgi:nitroimidazol reductase NimA-like FMN-containing flavoprotein (pyridoxamine 5'-phosphate oxidase superfamily)/osmotically-inducible protein OsmY